MTSLINTSVSVTADIHIMSSSCTAFNGVVFIKKLIKNASYKDSMVCTDNDVVTWNMQSTSYVYKWNAPTFCLGSSYN